ncbi:MAG: hypothetical protein RLZ95_1295 [Bacteroidota bacterium]|jgi:uncharacterized protein YdhG (YjbR/CyaY superfamily)
MKEVKKSFTTIDEYIQLQDKAVQVGLNKIRAAIKKAAPKASEGISYQMPGFKQNGYLVYFAAAKKHYGFYPTPKPIIVFKKQLDENGFPYSKGAIQFPLEKPIPIKLIQEIVKFRIQENEIKQASKLKKKSLLK